MYRDAISKLLAAAAMLGLAVPAGADENPQHNLKIGLGAGVTPEYEGADEYRFLPVVPFRYEHKWVTIQTIGLGAELDVSRSDYFDAGPVFLYRFARDSDVDDRTVRALPEVDASLEIGGFLRSGVPLRMVGFDDPAIVFGQVAIRQDVLGGHDGFVVAGSLGVTRPIGDRLSAIVFGTTTFASDNYMSSYYDVTAAGSAASGLAVFDADAGIKDVGATAILDYKFTEKWSASLLGSYARLVGDAAASPVVSVAGSKDQFTAGFAISYKFF